MENVLHGLRGRVDASLVRGLEFFDDVVADEDVEGLLTKKFDGEG